MTGVENLKDHSEVKNRINDPARLKQLTNDLQTSLIQPLSSFELKLYTRYQYRVRTRDLNDENSFLKLEIIARTFKELINKDL